MKYHYATSLFILLAPLGIRAQQEASTLEELCRNSSYVATARLAQQSETKRTIQVSFDASHWWKGKRKEAIVFSESIQAHCGSALRGLKTNQEYVLFFEVRGTGTQLVGGARGVVRRTQAIESAVKALLLVKTPAARARLLAGQLTHRETRIREDAALALANLPGLETSNAVTRTLLLTHLDKAMPATGSKKTGSASLGALLLANSRLNARKTAERAWTLAILEEHTELSSLGREVLLRHIGTPTMLATVPMTQAKTHGSRLLLLNALDATRSRNARPWVAQLLREKDLILQRQATMTMLSLGSKPGDLSKVVGRDMVLQAETLRAERTSRPRLRAIRPR